MEYAQEARFTFMDRIRRRMFPVAPRPVRAEDPRSYLTTNVVVHVDWLDRLRLLWSGRALIQITTYTDLVVQDAESLSNFSVIP
jgi:hypothetical protein